MKFSQLTTYNFNIAKNECVELLLWSLLDLCVQIIINITNNNVANTIHFDDVTSSIL